MTDDRLVNGHILYSLHGCHYRYAYNTSVSQSVREYNAKLHTSTTKSKRNFWVYFEFGDGDDKYCNRHRYIKQ